MVHGLYINKKGRRGEESECVYISLLSHDPFEYTLKPLVVVSNFGGLCAAACCSTVYYIWWAGTCAIKV
jgi:hypothetical protein